MPDESTRSSGITAAAVSAAQPEEKREKMSEHLSVSSDDVEFEIDRDEVFEASNQPVSSEAESADEVGEIDLVEVGSAPNEDVELEEVEGFELAPSETLSAFAEKVSVSKELKDIPPAGPELFGPETVCGDDNRVRISPANRHPWRMNCQLIITQANGNRVRCTGWFIGPRTVMTSGHCVFGHGSGGWARQIEVIPGMDGSSRPYGSQVATSFRSVRGWTRSANGNPDYDYGAIILPNNNLGNRVGWYGFASLSSSSLTNMLVNNSGYPGDKPFGTQWYNAGRIDRVTSRMLFYMIDTFGGQSGSAIYRLRNGQRHAVGVHGYGGCPNKAVRINRPVFRNMKAWKQLGFA